MDKTCLKVIAVGQIDWSLQGDTLRISGSGEMENYAKDTHPWHDDLDSIQHVVVEEGVTSVSTYLCFKAANLETVSLPSTLSKIGGSAFRTCASLASLYIPGTVTEMGVPYV